MRRSWTLLLLTATACGSPPEDAAPPKAAAADAPPVDAAAPAKQCVLAGRVLSELDEPVTLSIDTVLPWMHGMEKDLPKQHFEAVVKPGESFRFEGLDPGVYWVTASSPSSAMHDYFQATVTDDVRDFEARVRRACRLRVRVTFGEGIEPADCWLRYDIPTGGFDQPRGLPRSGRFEVARLEPGDVGVLVRHWPDRGPDGAEPPLRVESYVRATLVPGDNDVEVRIDANSPRVK